MEMLKGESVKEWFEEIATNPVRTSFWALILSTFFVIGLTLYLKLYDPAFLENVLVEAHGMLFDILVIGLFILWLNEKGKKQTEIQRYLDEIDDFRGWKSEEAARRIRGNIVRLNRKGISKIPLYTCYLERANLHRANLGKADLYRANLGKATLVGTNLEGAFLMGANLERANLGRATSLTIEQLSKVKTLYRVKCLDLELMEQIKEKYPHLLEKPKDE